MVWAIASSAGRPGDCRIPAVNSSGTPHATWNRTTASPRRPAATRASISSRTSGPVGSSNDSGGSSSANAVSGTPAAAACRAGTAPDEKP